MKAKTFTRNSNAKKVFKICFNFLLFYSLNLPLLEENCRSKTTFSLPFSHYSTIMWTKQLSGPLMRAYKHTHTHTHTNTFICMQHRRVNSNEYLLLSKVLRVLQLIFIEFKFQFYLVQWAYPYSSNSNNNHFRLKCVVFPFVWLKIYLYAHALTELSGYLSKTFCAVPYRSSRSFWSAIMFIVKLEFLNYYLVSWMYVKANTIKWFT